METGLVLCVIITVFITAILWLKMVFETIIDSSFDWLSMVFIICLLVGIVYEKMR